MTGRHSDVDFVLLPYPMGGSHVQRSEKRMTEKSRWQKPKIFHTGEIIIILVFKFNCVCSLPAPMENLSCD